LRVVEDAGVGSGPWTSYVASILNGGTVPDPQRVLDVEAQFLLQNGLDVLTDVVTDAKDTADHDVIVLDVSNPGAPNGMSASRPIANVDTSASRKTLTPRRLLRTSSIPVSILSLFFCVFPRYRALQGPDYPNLPQVLSLSTDATYSGQFLSSVAHPMTDGRKCLSCN
jgi:hypothetical protein